MRYATRILCCYPLVVMGFFYATWGAGRLALGYWPRSGLDDPQNIEGGLMWLYDVTAVLFVIGFPLFLLAAPVLGLVFIIGKPAGWKNRLVELVAALVLCMGLVLFIRWDPQSVMGWYFH